VLVLVGWGRVHTDAAGRLAAQSILLGEAARISGTAYEDILTAYPRFPEGARLILFKEGIPAAAFETGRELFQLAYDNPSLIVEYSTMDSFSPENEDVEKIIAFKWMGEHFVDVTPFLHQHLEFPRTKDSPAATRTMRDLQVNGDQEEVAKPPTSRRRGGVVR
jgi:hypothetical protein